MFKIFLILELDRLRSPKKLAKRTVAGFGAGPLDCIDFWHFCRCHGHNPRAKSKSTSSPVFRSAACLSCFAFVLALFCFALFHLARTWTSAKILFYYAKRSYVVHEQPLSALGLHCSFMHFVGLAFCSSASKLCI